MTSIKIEATNGLAINSQVNISNSIQIILTMKSQSLGSHLLHFLTLKEFLIFIGIMLQTFDAKYLNGFKPKFVVLTVFLKKSQALVVSTVNTGIIILLKACVHYFLSNFYFSRNDSPSKTIKNVFYFI